MPRLTQLILLGLLFATPAAVAASDQQAESVRSEQADYPGNYRLIWYYTAEDVKRGHPSRVLAHSKEFLIGPAVKAPTVNSIFLLEHAEVHAGEEVLDMGTGSGIHAVFAAEKAGRVVATDIYPPAVENARFNADYHGVADKIDFRVGDLFGPLKADEKFDVVYFNIAYPFGEATLDRWHLHERFFAQVKKHLKPHGRIYYQVGFVRNIPYIHDMLERNRLAIMRMEMVNAVRYGTEPIMMMIQAK